MSGSEGSGNAPPSRPRSHRVDPTRAVSIWLGFLFAAMMAMHAVHIGSDAAAPAGSASAAAVVSTPVSSTPAKLEPCATANPPSNVTIRFFDEGLGAEGRTAFVNRPDGSLRGFAKTDHSGTAHLYVAEGDSVSLAYGTSKYELLTYFGVSPGESLIAGEPEDDEPAPVVARFQVTPPAAPGNADPIRVSAGNSELELGAGRQLAVPSTLVQGGEYQVLARAVGGTLDAGAEERMTVLQRKASDSTPLALPALTSPSKSFAVTLGGAVDSAVARLSFDFGEGHFPMPMASCGATSCAIRFPASIKGAPHLRIEANEGGRTFSYEERLAEGTMSSRLRSPVLRLPKAPLVAGDGAIDLPSAPPASIVVVESAWPADTRAHVRTVVGDASLKHIPALRVPPALEEYAFDPKGSYVVRAEVVRASHVEGARAVRNKGLDALYDLPPSAWLVRAGVETRAP